MSALQLLSYFSLLFFIAIVAAKMAKIASMPVHLRWDLYPIPHERGKEAYGGSYFEELDWWTKPKDFSLINEIKEMGKEIFFIQSLYHNNRSLWIFSFPFHVGMYSLIGLGALLVVGALLQVTGVAAIAATGGTLGMIIYYLTTIAGIVGWILATIGAISLFLSRLIKSELRKASVLSDYVNLLFLLAVFASGLISWLTVDPDFSFLRGYVTGLITLKGAGALPVAVSVQLWIAAGLLIYFPFTHMTHLFGKYFTYHKIRWEDAPNIRGGKIEKAVAESLGYTLTWSAPHIKTGATWAEAATEEKQSNEK